jgi:hypothetical protein
MPSRNTATARQVWWASVPVWSIGFLSPVLSPDRVDDLRDLMIFP